MAGKEAAPEERYVALLRRELTRAQARLKRAERERDRLREENEKLRARLEDAAPRRAKPLSP